MIRHPLTREQLAPLPTGCKIVCVKCGLSDQEHERVGKFIAKHPDIRLVISRTATDLIVEKNPLPVENLEFLRFYPTVRSLSVMVWELKTFSGIEALEPVLKNLELWETKSSRLSLAFLRSFKMLDSLFLEKHATDLDAVAALKNLGRLTLRSITLPDLKLLLPLKNLWSLDIKLGGTKDLNLLHQIGKLKHLELWQIKGLADIDAFAQIPTLQNIHLESLKQVARLPSLNKLRQLRRVTLHNMAGISDLSPVAKAPALEELLVVDAKHLQPEDFNPFIGHLALKSARIGLGSLRKNERVQQLLGLPKGDGLTPEFIYR